MVYFIISSAILPAPSIIPLVAAYAPLVAPVAVPANPPKAAPIGPAGEPKAAPTAAPTPAPAPAPVANLPATSSPPVKTSAAVLKDPATLPKFTCKAVKA